MYSLPCKIKIDTKQPSSIINQPIINGIYSRLNNVTGLAFDLDNGTGVKKVDIAIVRLNDNNHWNGSAWISEESWLQASGNTTWFYNSSLVQWSSGIMYEVRSRAIDNIGNMESSYNIVKFTIDFDFPISKIIVPKNNIFLNELNSISGIAIDTGNMEIDIVEICINRKSDDKSWSGSNWVSTETWLITEGNISWTYDVSSIIWDSGSQYIIRSCAIDHAKNIETPAIGNTFTFDAENVIFSDTKPKSTDVSPRKDVEVAITLSDSISGVNASDIEYSASTDDGINWEPWIPVSDLEDGNSIEIKLNLTFPNGTGNRIKWRASDIAGNGPTESVAYIVKVNTWLQQFLPKVKLNAPKNNSIVTTDPVELSWSLIDTNPESIINLP